MNRNRKVLLIGWDAADWKVIHPLMDAGGMPNVQRLVERGTIGPIATLHPPLSPMLWTSIATGKRPFKHGIHGFAEPTPDGLGVRPVTNLSRRCKAVWNILNQSGRRSIVVGWWPSHPAEPIDGVMVSDQYHRAHGPLAEGWPLRAGSVHPAELHETLAALRFHPDELSPAMIEPFIPRAREIDQDEDRRLAGCAATLCECVSIHAAATWLIENRPWDLFAVYYDAIDHFCHGFMRYHPPRQEGIPERDFELYRNVVSMAYRFHDRMLGALLQKAGDDATVILVSDHGFHPDHLRPRAIPMVPAGPAIEHRDLGILAMCGPGIRRDELLHGACVLDVAPTVLALFGLPVGDDMDGNVLVGAFEEPPEVRTIPSWEEVPGADGRHPSHTRLDPEAARECLEQLVALGYIARPDADAEKAVAETIDELQFNLAAAYQDADRHGEALEILRRLHRADPDEQRYAVHRFVSCQALGRTDEMREIVEDLDGRRRELASDARARLRELAGQARARAEAESSQDAAHAVSPAPRAVLSEDERRELARCRNLARFDPPVVDYLKARIHASEGRHAEALALLGRVQEAHLTRPGLLLQTAELLTRLRSWDEAERAYARALDIDPDNPHAHAGMSRLALRRRDFGAAAGSALDAIQRLYHYPMAHFLLGAALAGLQQFGRAAEALRTALSLNPNFPEAHRRLAGLLRRLGEPAAADDHLRLSRELRRSDDGGPTARPAEAATPREPPATARAAPAAEAPPAPAAAPGEAVVIVSGLPRSGTSMVMQMLAAGGFPVCTDHVRAANEDNPLGYFEYEPVKHLHEDAGWMEGVRGRAIKVVAPLLRYLPGDLDYRVIFIERPVEEVVASQRRMLERGGATLADSPARRGRLEASYVRQVQNLKRTLGLRPRTRVLFLEHAGVMGDPPAAADAIGHFLGTPLDTAAMAAAVQPRLHRQRSDPEISTPLRRSPP